MSIIEPISFQYDDGGREAAGYKGKAGDCVCRAIVIASGLPYQEVYDALAEGNKTERCSKRSRYSKASTGVKTARHGIHIKRKWFKDYMQSLGFTKTPTMFIGSGCRVHLKQNELPEGRLVVQIAGHFTSVINGVLHDTWNCSEPRYQVGMKDGVPFNNKTYRCVYGYWSK